MVPESSHEGVWCPSPGEGAQCPSAGEGTRENPSAGEGTWYPSAGEDVWCPSAGEGAQPQLLFPAVGQKLLSTLRKCVVYLMLSLCVSLAQQFHFLLYDQQRCVYRSFIHCTIR